MAENTDQKIKDIEIKLDAALDAIDNIATLVDEKVAAAIAVMSSKVESSLSLNATPAKPKPLVDPGTITIEKVKYKFTDLAFRVAAPDGKGLIKVTAEQVAADKDLAAKLLVSNPSIFEKIGD